MKQRINRSKRKLLTKIVPALSLGAIGLTALSASCGRPIAESGTASYQTYVYKYRPDVFTKYKTDDQLVAWLPWTVDKGNYAEIIGTWLQSAFPNIRLIYATKKSPTYVVDGEINPGVSYSEATNTLNSQIRAGNVDIIPDIVINYAEAPATLEKYGLLQPLGDVSKVVTPGLLRDSYGVFSSSGSGSFLPFAKSTELISVDTVVLAKIFADIAGLKGATDQITVPTNSAQHRMIKMILDPAAEKRNLYDDVSVTPQNVQTKFLWADLKAAYTQKTSVGGTWEKDKAAVESNFKLNEARKYNLLQIDWSQELFSVYDDLRNLVLFLTRAYDTKTETTKDRSTYIIAYDNATTQIYSYLYAKAGHTQSNFIITNSTIDRNPAINFNFEGGIVGAAFQDSYNNIRTIVNSDGAYLRGGANASYGAYFLKEHRAFMGIGSSSGTLSPTDSKDQALANPGEIYFDLQPQRTSTSETKRSIINQGPGISVSKIHGEAKAAEIASKLLDLYKQGGKIENGKELGYWAGPQNTYLYGNTETYEDGTYLAWAKQQVDSSTNWGPVIGKYLLGKYYKDASDHPDQFDLYINPTGPTTNYVRIALDAHFAKEFSNYPETPIAPFKNMVSTIISDGINDQAFEVDGE